ncbi:O-methyltransferase [Xylanimonas ulmi]|uniref:Putative O-methyltransferase YrrM n=1 Tax=Xylanimonas ulmi TaxID=228973 RepID=A0A4V2EY49_9MICO|nr:class I SAM-dependent methyltransferase [Xylanibacterium ulmi]RZS61750.1 putative O-methyltransferase YrrM [Xylanibacterium ulmi]
MPAPADLTAHDRTASWLYAEGFVPEDEALLAARERAAELGCRAVSAGVGALLSVLAAALHARAAVEVGAGAGVASLWLLRGMPDDGVLTTIDSEREHLRAARIAFDDAGLAPRRTRTIPGRPADVLPRLADAAYDLVLLGGDPAMSGDHLDDAVRLLRPGGMLAVDGALHGGQVADPARRDEVTTAVRALGRAVRADERLICGLAPVGDGLLLATRRPA